MFTVLEKDNTFVECLGRVKIDGGRVYVGGGIVGCTNSVSPHNGPLHSTPHMSLGDSSSPTEIQALSPSGVGSETRRPKGVETVGRQGDTEPVGEGSGEGSESVVGLEGVETLVIRTTGRDMRVEEVS